MTLEEMLETNRRYHQYLQELREIGTEIIEEKIDPANASICELRLLSMYRIASLSLVSYYHDLKFRWKDRKVVPLCPLNFKIPSQLHAFAWDNLDLEPHHLHQLLGGMGELNG